MISTYPKESDVLLSPHFYLREFSCPCPQCTTTTIDSDLITKLEAIRTLAGPIKINSGYRCPHHQDELRAAGYPTSTGPSTHSEGRAIDFMSEDSRFSGASLEDFARSCGFTSVGVAPNWVHCDLRPGYRRWTYSK